MMVPESGFQEVYTVNSHLSRDRMMIRSRRHRFSLHGDRGTSFLVFLILYLSGCASAGTVRIAPGGARTYMEETLSRFIDSCTSEDCGFRLDPGARVDSFKIAADEASVDIFFNEAFAQVPFREDMLARLRTYIRHHSVGDYSPDL